MLNVLMFPSPDRIRTKEDGISQVVLNYGRYASQFDITYVTEDDEFDLIAVHAGMVSLPKDIGVPVVSINHGLYWTGDRSGAGWELEANRNVVSSIRAANAVTVPSSWVAEAFQRDMHFTPYIVPHGVNIKEWKNLGDGGFVLWNKNRQTTTCNPQDVSFLARTYPGISFISTFGEPAQNVNITGKLPFEQMKQLVQQCTVYLSTTKETGGIGIMEAMASGKPILGYREGAIVDLVQHGVNGYLATGPQDLAQGLQYCLDNYETLGENSRVLARNFTWEKTCEKLANVYRQTAKIEPPTTAIIIPCYNYGHMVGRAIESCLGQADEIIVVDDGSTDDTRNIVSQYPVKYIYQNNKGVGIARNTGIAASSSKYVCCLDADDQISPGFISTCVRELENDITLGAAYTKLRLMSRDGTKATKKASSWPDEFDYDKQLMGQNQIPTCCVFRREAWNRLGGYRQRYAPRGCGTEDAEFWLRMGAIGYGAKLASEEPLFIYSFGGNTTGDSTYEEVDWRLWHPWTRDGKHPFASVATPVNKSHPVRSYDTPLVSVIIPVGPGHETDVINAIDSLEAQTVRQWECIVVWDSPNIEMLEMHKLNYPFVKWLETGGEKGAGYARNRGAEIARAELVDFLDADDWFYPEMLERKLSEYATNGGDVAVYTDSVGQAIMSPEAVKSAKPGKILFYEPTTQQAIVAQQNLEYDCELAREQPNPARMYIWCYISTLHPKEWFFEVGGFDEEMESWEDWDYWLRLSMLGKCFIHIEEELMVYPYYTGNRREIGKQKFESLVQYMKGKYERMDTMPCSSCGKPSNRPAPRLPARQPITMSAQAEGSTMFDFDRDMVLATYTSPNRGDHLVIGHAVFSTRLPRLNMVQTEVGYRINYGYHAGGSRFVVHRDEFLAAPHLFQAVASTVPEVQVASQRRATLPPTPQVLEEKDEIVELAQRQMPPSARRILEQELERDEIAEKPRKPDIQLVPGISADIAEQLKELGVDTQEDILTLGIDGLKEIRGIGEKKAAMIISAIEDRMRG